MEGLVHQSSTVKKLHDRTNQWGGKPAGKSTSAKKRGKVTRGEFEKEFRKKRCRQKKKRAKTYKSNIELLGKTQD